MPAPADSRTMRLATVSAIVFLIGLIAVVADVPGVATVLDRAAPMTTSSSTTTTAPPLFPALEDRGGGALRTPTGHIVPIVGGEPDAYVVRTPCYRDVVAAGERIPSAHVVLDPGHGGAQEPGAVGPGGLRESDVNLDVALRTKAALEAAGATVVLTRETDQRVSIPTRAEIITALRPLVMVSIHHNAGPLAPSEVPGIEMYHQHQVVESARLGGLLHEELHAAFAPFDVDWSIGRYAGVRARIDSDGVDFYGMLRRTAGVPSVLSEAAFISNPSEEAALATEAFRQAEADAIAAAVIRHVGTPDQGTGYGDAFTAASSPGGGGGTADCTDPPLA